MKKAGLFDLLFDMPCRIVSLLWLRNCVEKSGFDYMKSTPRGVDADPFKKVELYPLCQHQEELNLLYSVIVHHWHLAHHLSSGKSTFTYMVIAKAVNS